MYFIEHGPSGASLEHPLKEMIFTCTKCQKVVTVSTDKEGLKKVCPECNASGVKVWRAGSKGTSADFAKLEPHEAEAFWNDVKNMSQKQVEAHIAKVFKREKVSENVGQTYGDYLPLKVHEKNGWSPEKVKAYNDTLEHETFGLLYRVPVQGRGHKDTDRTTHADELVAKAKAKAKPKPAPKKAARPKELAEWTDEHHVQWASAEVEAITKDLNSVSTTLGGVADKEKIPAYVLNSAMEAVNAIHTLLEEIRTVVNGTAKASDDLLKRCTEAGGNQSGQRRCVKAASAAIVKAFAIKTTTFTAKRPAPPYS